MKKWSWARFDFCWLRLLLSGMVVIVLSIHAVAAHAYGATQCAADRFGSNLVCTANDLLVSNLQLAGGSPPATCFSGQSITVDLVVTVGFGSASRYDVGVFFPADIASASVADQRLESSSGGPTVCSVKTLSIPPFQNLNSNVCGDGSSGLVQDTTLYTVTLPCRVAPGSGGNLSTPYLVSYTNSAGATCTGPNDVVPETKSKCNAPTSASVPVVVVPNVTITDNKSTTYPGATNTYEIVISNASGATMSGVTFSDPAVPNLTFTSVTCSGASCPSASIVTLANLTAGISLPDIPNGGSLTFIVIGTVGAVTIPTTLTNTAKVTVLGQTASVSDIDTVMVPPTAIKSFSPSEIAPGGTSTLTITLTNPNTIAVNGVAFTDAYPSGMTNSSAPSNACGGSVTTPSSTSLSLSGGTIPAGGSCSVTVNVTATTTGLNSTGTITTTNAGSRSAAASGTLQVISPVGGFNAFETSTAANAVTGNIYTKLAGTAFSLDVVAISGSSQATGFSNNVKVELLANTGTVGSGYGADNCPTSSSVVQTIASATIAGGRSTVPFSAVANAYRDVRVRISYPTTSPTIVICSSDSFAIRPSALTLHTDANATAPSASAMPVIKAGSAFTLYATTGSGTNYSGTLTLDVGQLTAQTASQDTVVQSGGVVGTLLPSTLAVNPASVPSNNASYTEVGYLYLGAGAYRDDAFTSVDQPDDCISGSSDDVFTSGKIGCLIGNYTAVSLGRFIPDHFALTTRGTIIAGSNSLVVDSAAGISVGMTLSVAGAGVAGASLTSTVTAVAGTTITLSLSAAASVANASVVLSSLQTRADLAATGSSFTYMDEPMKLTFNVIACNSAEGVTQNYAGSFAKLGAPALGTGSNWFNTGCTGASQCFGLGAVNGATGLSGRLSIDTSVANPASLWATGVGTVVAYMKFNRNATPDGPYQALKIGAMPRDSDGVTLPDPASSDAHKVDLDATTGNTLASNPDGVNERKLLFTTDVRFGRLWIGNAYGPEQRDLTIPFEAQYWNGNAFIKNTADSLTSIAKTNIGLGNHLPSGFSASVDLTHIPAGPFPVVSGSGSLTLIKPSGSPLSGSVDIVFDLGATTTTNTSWTPSLPPTAGANMGYLRGKWYGAAYDRDPTARATFGIFGSSLKKGPIYLRENY